jgi:hypothetical protein
MRGCDRRGHMLAAKAVLGPLAAALVFAPGCGEDGDEQASPARTGTVETRSDADAQAAEPTSDPAHDEASIQRTLEAVLTGSDPGAACGELVTERFLRRAYGNAGRCEAARRGEPPAKEAGVTQIVIHPDSVAQALSSPRGGPYDGQRLRAELVLDDDVWKLDSLRSNVAVGP